MLPVAINLAPSKCTKLAMKSEAEGRNQLAWNRENAENFYEVPPLFVYFFLNSQEADMPGRWVIYSVNCFKYCNVI